MPNVALSPAMSSDLAALLIKQGKTGLSYGNLKSLMRDLTIWASPSARTTRSLVTILEQIGSKGPNYLRGISSLAALAEKMEAEKPPPLLRTPDPSMPPAPFAPADAGMSPVLFHQNR